MISFRNLMLTIVVAASFIGCSKTDHKTAASEPAIAPTKTIKYYRNPMDPSVHSEHAMKDSMGMDYIPVYETSATQGDSPDGKTVGRGAFTLTPEQLKLSGTSEATVEKKDLIVTARVPGRVIGGSRVSFQAFEQDASWSGHLHRLDFRSDDSHCASRRRDFWK
jgi:Cu(I)/Ag(I) efflux system membrane fusion protein